nr:hypothetical protein [Tanacetum cinerariifolium]
WAYAFHQDKASLVRVPVANVTLSSSTHLLRENIDSDLDDKLGNPLMIISKDEYLTYWVPQGLVYKKESDSGDCDNTRDGGKITGGGIDVVGKKMHKAFPLPVIEFLLAEEVPTASEESYHCQKKREATAKRITLLSFFMDAATVLAAGVADVPTSSRSIPTASHHVPAGSGSIPTASPPAAEVPTSSDVVPTASLVSATATMVTPYRRRKGKEIMVESETPKKKKVQEQIDAQVARDLKSN